MPCFDEIADPRKALALRCCKMPNQGIHNLYCEESIAVFVIQRSSSAKGTVKQAVQKKKKKKKFTPTVQHLNPNWVS
jgi:hypothetical protein